jgi:predicted DsbA family dithiol-disulfide isomerase
MAQDPVVRVPLFYDFSSTICYFTHRVLGRLAPELAALGVALDWWPIDLVGITVWRRGEPYELDRKSNLERLSRELDVPVVMPSHWMDSRPAMGVALDLAASPADEERWRAAVWSWVYEHGRMLDTARALDEIAAQAALSIAEPSSRALQEVERRTMQAHAAGVRGVPTFLLDVWPVGIGIQQPDTMLDFLRRFAAKKRAEPSPH